jgi:hypothetical protein
MKISTIALAGVFVAISSLAIAETGAPSGQGSTTGIRPPVLKMPIRIQPA